MDASIRSAAVSPWALYTEAARQGRLLYQVDPASGRAFFPPRPVAPESGRPPESRLSDGRGTIYSVTCIAGRAGPRIMALVDLAEGFRVLARIEGAAPEAAAIGLAVRLRPAPAAQPELLVFEPAAP